MLSSDPSQFGISGLTLADLLYDLQTASTSSPQPDPNGYLDRIKVFNFDLGTIPHYIQFKKLLQKTGITVDNHELISASLAQQHGLTVLSRNSSQLTMVPGLQIEVW